MEENYPLSRLHTMKARLGPLAFIKFEAPNLRDVHYQIGELAQAQIQKILKGKLARLSAAQRAQEIASARQIHAALREKAASPAIDFRVRKALGEYLDCLAAWSQGARLNVPWASTTPAGPPSPLELGLFLQKEQAGCQTGVYRLEDGSVLLWHTEEDGERRPGSRFDRLRIVSYPIQAGHRVIEVNAFLYPDLLPGPCFGWRSDRYLQAVDSLPLRPCLKAGAILANVATWVTLHLGGEMNLQETIDMLAPCWDGYALTTGQEKNGRVQAQKIEFAGEESVSSVLNEQPGAFLFQVNLFSEHAAALAAAYQAIPPQRRALLEKRLARTHQALLELKPDRQAQRQSYALLCSRSGGSYAYANGDVKGTFIGRLTPGCLEAWVGAGPALENDLPNLTRIMV